MTMGEKDSAISETAGSIQAKITRSAATATDPHDEICLSAPWEWWREQMPITAQWAYFDHAAVAPLSRPAADAISKLADQGCRLGDTAWPQWSAELAHLRRASATMLGCEIGEICFIPNTTTGINLVAEGWNWQPGDNVVLPEGEFPSNLFPWLNQQSRGVEIRIVPRRGVPSGSGEARGDVLVDDLMDRVDESTKIIAVSWVGYASGFRLDLESLVQRAHERGVLVFLDAIQGLGMFPLDVSKIPVDFLAADGHKWLLGPEGAGVAMIRQPHQGRLRAGNVGWASVKNSHNYSDPKLDLRDDATRFESGSGNMLGGAALAASMEMFLTIRRLHGEDAIENRVLELVQLLDDRLRAVGAVTSMPALRRHRSGILNFSIPGVEPSKFREHALEKNVVVSCRGGGIRASVHAYNDETDISRLVDVARTMNPSFS